MLAPVTTPIAGTEIRDRLEANLQGAVVTAAPTVGQSAATPAFGTFPRPGHVALVPNPATALTKYLLSR